MDAERRSEITGWDAREFSGGFAGLGRLVDRGFSGAVTDGAAAAVTTDGRALESPFAAAADAADGTAEVRGTSGYARFGADTAAFITAFREAR